MYIQRSAAGLVIQAPAKVNLFFEVLGKRTDGYHEIETLMCPIDLYDTLSFREEPGEGLSPTTTGRPPIGSSNSIGTIIAVC